MSTTTTINVYASEAAAKAANVIYVNPDYTETNVPAGTGLGTSAFRSLKDAYEAAATGATIEITGGLVIFPNTTSDLKCNIVVNSGATLNMQDTNLKSNEYKVTVNAGATLLMDDKDYDTSTMTAVVFAGTENAHAKLQATRGSAANSEGGDITWREASVQYLDITASTIAFSNDTIALKDSEFSVDKFTMDLVNSATIENVIVNAGTMSVKLNETNSALFKNSTLNVHTLNVEGRGSDGVFGKTEFINTDVNAGTVNLADNSTVNVDIDSTITADAIAGAGKINIDAYGYTSGTVAKILNLTSGIAADVEINNLPAGAYFERNDQGDLVITDISRDTLYVNSEWAGEQVGEKVADGKYFGINAFATTKDALAVANTLGGERTIELSNSAVAGVADFKEWKAGTYTITGGDGDLLPGFHSQQEDDVIVNINGAHVAIGKIIAGSGTNKDTENQYNITNSTVDAVEYTGGAAWWTMWGKTGVTIENSVVGLRKTAAGVYEGTIDAADTHTGNTTNATDKAFGITYGSNSTMLNFGSAGDVTVKDSTLITGFFQVADRGLTQLDNSLVFVGGSLNVGYVGQGTASWGGTSLDGYRTGEVAELVIGNHSYIYNAGWGNGNTDAGNTCNIGLNIGGTTAGKLTIKDGSILDMSTKGSDAGLSDDATIYGNGEMIVEGASKFDARTFTIQENGKLTIAAGSEVTVETLAGAGEILIDTTAFSATDDILKVLQSNGSTFTGTVSLTGENTHGAYLVQGADGDIVLTDISRDTLYVNSEWAGEQVGEKVADGKYFGINAFANSEDAFATANEVGGATIDLGDEAYVSEALISKMSITNAGTYTLIGGKGVFTNYEIDVNKAGAGNTGDFVINVGSATSTDKTFITATKITLRDNGVLNVNNARIDFNVFEGGSAYFSIYKDSVLNVSNSTIGYDPTKAGNPMYNNRGPRYSIYGTANISGSTLYAYVGQANGTGFDVQGNGNVTMTDYSTLYTALINVGTGYSTSYIEDGTDTTNLSATLTLDGVMIENTMYRGDTNTPAVVNGIRVGGDSTKGTLDINGSTIDFTKILYNDARELGLQISANGTVSIDDSTIILPKATNAGTISIDGGNFTAATVTNNGTFTAENATLTADKIVTTTDQFTLTGVTATIGELNSANARVHLYGNNLLKISKFSGGNSMWLHDEVTLLEGSSVTGDTLRVVRDAQTVNIGTAGDNSGVITLSSFDNRDGDGAYVKPGNQTININDTLKITGDWFSIFGSGERDDNYKTVVQGDGRIDLTAGTAYLALQFGDIEIDVDVTTKEAQRFTLADILVKSELKAIGGGSDHQTTLQTANVTVAEGGLIDTVHQINIGYDGNTNFDQTTKYKSTLTLIDGGQVKTAQGVYINTESVVDVQNGSFSAQETTTNYGTISVAGSSTFDVADLINNANATISVNGGTFDADKVTNDGTFNISGTSDVSATLEGDGIYNIYDATLTGNITSNSSLYVTGDKTTTLKTDVAGTGKIYVGYDPVTGADGLGTKLLIDGTATVGTLTNSGTVTVDGTANITTLINSGSVTVDGTAKITALTNNAGGTITVNSNNFSVDTLNNAGLITVNSEYITVGTVSGNGTIAMDLGSVIKWSGDLSGLVTLDVTAYADGEKILVFDFLGDANNGSAASFEALYTQILGGAYSTNYFKIVNNDLYYYRPDVTAPVAPVLTPNTTDPTNQAVTVTAQFSETDSVKEYSPDGVTWFVIDPAKISAELTWTQPFDENGKIYFRETDASGNMSNVSLYEVTNIDKIAPHEPDATASITKVTNQDVIVTAVFSDDSVMKYYQIVENGASVDATKWVSYTGSIIVKENCDVYFMGEDAATNQSNLHKLEITNIDKVAPDAPANITLDHDKMTNESVKVTAEFSTDSVIKQYSFDGTTWELYAGEITMTANGTIYFRGIDEAGNISNVVSKEVHLIDTDAPDAPVVSANANPTNQPVVVTATFSADSVTKQYSIDGGLNWIDYVDGVTVGTDANGTTIIFRGTDAAGNSSETSYTVNNIDTKEPELHASQVGSAMTNGNVTVNVTSDDPDAPIYYLISTEAITDLSTATGWELYTGNVTMIENGHVYFKSTDAAGNTDYEDHVVSNIDKSAPAIAIALDKDTDATSVKLTATVTKDSDAEAVTVYYYDNATQKWVAYTGSTYELEAKTNGTYYFKAVDAAGNETVQSIVVSNVDSAAPTLNITGDLTKPAQSVKLNVTAFDDMADTVTIKYSIDYADGQGTDVADAILGTDGKITVTGNGIVTITATDAAGNETTQTVNVTNVDTTPATLDITQDVTADTNGNVIVMATANETATIYYSFDKTDWKVYNGGVLLEENGTIYFKSVDVAGNWSDVISQTVSNIDKTAPVAPTASADKTTATNGDVIVSATFSGDSVVKQYKIGENGEWQNYTGDIKFEENGSIFFRSQDAAGNWSDVTSYVVGNIDKKEPEAPAATADVIKATNGNVIVSASFSSDSVVKEYSTDGGNTWEVYGGSVLMTANGTVQFRGTDAAGNVSAVTSYVVGNIDKEKPTIGTITGNPATVTKDDVVLKATASDNANGATLYYSFDQQNWIVYNDADGVVVEKNGNVYFKAIDGVGNVSEITTVVVDKIDKTAPTLDVTGNATAWTKNDVVLSVTSNTAEVIYSIDYVDSALADVTEAKVIEGKITVVGNATVTITTTDEAGNVTTQTVVVDKIDKVAPTLNITGNAADWTNQSITLTGTTSDDAVIYYSTTGNADDWTALGTGLIVDANGTYYFKAVDKAGNEVTQTVVVDKIDKAAPTLNITGNVNDWTNGNVTLVATTTDDSSAIVYYSFDNATWHVYDTTANALVIDSNKTVYFKSIDAAGNVTTAEPVVVDKIDKTPATLDITANTAMTKDSVFVKAEADDTAMTGTKMMYRVNGGAWMEYTAAGVEMTENGTVTFKFTDKAGNETTTDYVVSNIDKAAPVLNISGDVTTPTNGNVILNVITNDPDSAVYYSFNNQDWFVYTGTVEADKNGTVYFKSTDAAGNTGTAKIVVNNIDRTAPLAPTFEQVGGDASTQEDVIVKATYTDADIASIQYSTDNGNTWTAYTADGVTMTDNGTILFKATDKAGNVTETNYTVSNIDRDAPAAPIVSANGNPTNQPVVVTATFSSDSVKMEYSIDGGAWQTYDASTGVVIGRDSNGNIVNANGTTVTFRGTDAAGNFSETSYTVDNMDLTAPALTISGDFTTPTNGTVIANVASDDSEAKLYYLVSENVIADADLATATGWVLYTGNVTMIENGYVYFKGVDVAGNVSYASRQITNIDKIAPDAPTLTQSETDPVNTSVNVFATYGETGLTIQYSTDNGNTWIAYDADEGVEMDDNGTILFKATDAAGNFVETSYTVSNIDHDKPNAPAVSADGNPTNQPVFVYATFSSDSVTKEYKVLDADGNEVIGWTNYAAEGVKIENNNYTVVFRGTDAAGNFSETSYKVDNIDKTPATLEISGNPDQLTSLDVKLTATATDAHGATIFYSFDNINWIAYSGEVVVDSNRSVFFKAIDGAGNVTTQEVVVSKIDKDAPAISITGNATDWTNEDVVLLANTEAGATVKYSIDGGKNWIDYKATGVVMEENGTVIFKVTDSVGNVTMQEIVVDKIDKVVPTINITGNATDWTNQSITLTGTTSDDAVIYYSTTNSNDSADWKALGTGLIVDANGTYYFKAVDKAGNETAFAPVVVDKIDKTKPVVTITGNATAPTNQNVTLDAAVTDASNTAVIYYSFDNESWSVYSGSLTIDSNKTVFFKAIDAAGNVSVITPVKVDQIDKTAPVAPVASADITDATNGKVTVSADFSADSTVKEYSFDGKIWQTYTGGVEMTDNGTVYFRGTDEAGNTSESSYVVSNIDKVAPMTPSGAADITAATNGNVIVTGFFSSDSVKKEFKIVDAEGNVISDWAVYSTPVVMVDNGTVIFRATDAAGNISGEGSCVVSNIDKTAPAAPIAQADTTATQGNVTVYATFSTEADSIKQYSLDGSQWLAYNAENGVVMTANGTVWFREIDAAGNISDVTTYDVTNIDRNAPGAPVGYVEDPAVTDQPVTVYATFASDVVTKEYSLDGKTWYEYTDAGVVVEKNCNVYFRGTDAAGNVSPVGTYHVTNINYSTFSEYSMVEGVFEADAVKKEYSLNGYDWEEYTGDVKVTRTGTVFFRSTDASGVETINEKLVVTLNKDAKNDWNDLAQKGDKGEVISINGLDNKLDIDTVVTGNVGYVDQNDYYSFDLATAAKLSFYVNSTDNVKFVIYKLVPKTSSAGVTTYSLKAIQTTTVKAGYTVPSVNKLLAEGTYYVRVMSNNKNGGDANYTISMKETSVFFDRGSDADDWKDVKTAGAKGAVDTTSISVINKPGQEVLSNGWVGYGDQDDYIQFSLDDAAKLNFNFSSSDSAYFRIYKLVEKVNPKTGVKTYSLKWVQTTTVKAGYSVMSKDLLLDKGTYYFRVTSSNASKGGNAEYDISLNEISKFFTKGDKATDGVTALNDDWTDVKSKGATSAELDKNSLGKLTKDSKVNGWVGFGDTSDYMEFKLDTAANISFDVTSSDATRVVIYKLVENKNGTYTLKALQTTTLSKLANGTGYSKTTKGLNMAAGTYYVRVYSTNAAKGGDASYSLQVNSATRFYAEAGDNSDDTWKLAQATDSTMLKKNANTALNGWVGYSDASDYEKLQLDESGKVTLKLDAATAQAIDNKELKITVLDEKGKAVAMTWNTVNDTFTSDLKLADDAICYVGVSTTSASKFETEYKITAGIIVG